MGELGDSGIKKKKETALVFKLWCLVLATVFLCYILITLH